MVESVPIYTLIESGVQSVLSLATNLANNSAADNSNRGIDTVFKGATLFFEHSKLLYFILCQISILYVISLNPGKRKKRPDAG
jgi:hypothetical protein